MRVNVVLYADVHANRILFYTYNTTESDHGCDPTSRDHNAADVGLFRCERNLIMVVTQLMLGCFDVNGDATLASVSLNDMPACAVFNAPQSFAPSPHIPT